MTPNIGISGLSTGETVAVVGLGFILLLAWSLFWKGLALWHTAQRGQYAWFIIFLVVNTLGILEIIYLFGVAKLKPKKLFTSKGHHHE